MLLLSPFGIFSFMKIDIAGEPFYIIFICHSVVHTFNIDLYSQARLISAFI